MKVIGVSTMESLRPKGYQHVLSTEANELSHSQPVQPHDSNRLFIPVENVFVVDDLVLACRDISNITTHDYTTGVHYLNTMRKVIIGDYDSINKTGNPFTPVLFNSAGNIEDSNFLELNLCYSTDNIKKIVKQGVTTMAKIMDWKGCAVEMRVSILIYRMTTDRSAIINMPWHFDANSLTMTTLISPYYQDNGYFEGGDLLFAQKTQNFRYFCGMHQFMYNTAKAFQYPYNGGWIFDNVESMHKVGDMNAIFNDYTSTASVERVLFTIFANPPEEDIPKIARSMMSKNLA